VVPFNDLWEDPDILNCQIRSQTNIYNLLSKKGTLEKIKSWSGIVVNEWIPFSEWDNANVAEDLYKRSLAWNNTIDYIQAQLDSMQEIVNS
jgi:hypothetical protein